ncbi:hypothetical protein CMEL01_00939 [Colletotrichum melonis]|uniref:Uncharacterized protein n=1 Tax=Colletotrichum melonis TaxID=1209925 RepID=A0AAI9V251_9PEZI|nr:hypothetical protein CMEL01_00939 [Colletotrichum melonis]
MAPVRQLSVTFFLLVLLLMILFELSPVCYSHPPSSDSPHGCRLMTCPSL